MAQLTEIARLRERRLQLVGQSEQHRQRIAGELEKLRAAAHWIETGYTVVRVVRSSWPMIGSLAGLAVAWKGGTILKQVGKAWAWARLGKKLMGLWRQYAAPPPESEEGAS